MHFIKRQVSMFFLIVCGVVMLAGCQEIKDNNAKSKGETIATAGSQMKQARTPVPLVNVSSMSQQRIVIPSKAFTIKSSSQMNLDFYLSAGGILDGSTLWHAQTPPQYPEWVEIAYKNPIIVTKLKLEPQPNNRPGDGNHKRAPKDFIFQASNDEKAWVDLLTVKNNLHKDDNDWHEWKFTNHKKYSYYRMYITASDHPDLLTIQQLILE